MSGAETKEPLPLFPAKEKEPPGSEAEVLRHLAQTLSATKTLQRFPALKAKDLQEILLRSAQRAEESQPPVPRPTVRKELPEYFIYSDGASRGNPGEAGAGAVIADSRGRTLKEIKCFLGVTTNNVAEYRALLLALDRASSLGAGSITAHLDSELVVRQLRGEYKVREAHLKALHREALEALNRFARYRIIYIPREENRRADQLANEAIDQRNTKE